MPTRTDRDGREGTVRWSLVVPVKPLEAAKSRLAPLGDLRRVELALAFALDTVQAALECPRVTRVLVVSDDPRVRHELRASAALVEPDVPQAGLNPALRHGAAALRRLDRDTGVGALSADLPALRPDELSRALDAAAGHRVAFVGDAGGTGTTLLTAAEGHPLPPAFGPGSRSAHRASGAHEIGLVDVPSLRRDVDTPGDLEDAIRLGLGARTTAVLAALGTPG